MDLSALIFVALAVAWAAYLIPKALKHHEEDRQHRTVERFSSSMRVLASRDTADGRTTRLVVPGRPAGETVGVDAEAVVPPRPTGAARRRRRVLGTLLALTLLVGVLAAFSVVARPWLAGPVALLLAWLVACRVMVRSERGRPAVRVTPRGHRLPVAPRPAVPQPDVEPGSDDDGPLTEEMAAPTRGPEPDAPLAVPSEEQQSAADGWDPVPTTLPTYVSKEPAVRRSVRTIDLDSTGVWTSGRSESDSQLAREAEESARAERADREDAERAAQQERRRASGD